MGKIILIEPHRVLQQAIALALFPEHDVRVEDGAGASTAAVLDGMDLVIVDAAALRESSRLSPELARAIQGSSIPTLWIDENESADSPKRDKLVVVMKPIENAAFQSAVADLLSGSRPRQERKKAVPGEPKTQAAKGEKAKPEPIELVEIVEEESSAEKSETPKKSK
jgi:hypothetical protein